MLPFYDRLAQQTGNDNTLRARTAEANCRVGAIRQRLGQLDEAAKAFQRAIALYRELSAGSTANPNLKLEMARIDNELGRLFTSRRQVAEARQAHLVALALLEPDAALPSAPAAARFELARTCYFLGIQERPFPAAAPRREDRPAQTSGEQRDRLAQAVALLRGLPSAPSANPEYQDLLALCYLEGAAVGGARGAEARGGGEHAIEILESVVEAFPGISDYAYDLSEAYARIRIPRPPIGPDTENLIEERFDWRKPFQCCWANCSRGRRCLLRTTCSGWLIPNLQSPCGKPGRKTKLTKRHARLSRNETQFPAHLDPNYY